MSENVRTGKRSFLVGTGLWARTASRSNPVPKGGRATICNNFQHKTKDGSQTTSPCQSDSPRFQLPRRLGRTPD